MADLVKYIYGTEEQILALIPSNPNWIDKAFYFPTDKEYFYQAWEGVMKRYGYSDAASINVNGIFLNNNYLAGIKTKVLIDEVLFIPVDYDYNTYVLDVFGDIIVNGNINIL